jgi:hypothetical protein
MKLLMKLGSNGSRLLSKHFDITADSVGKINE